MHWHLTCANGHPPGHWTSETAFNKCPLCNEQLTGIACTGQCAVTPFKLTSVNQLPAVLMPVLMLPCGLPVPTPMVIVPVQPQVAPTVAPVLRFEVGAVLVDAGYRTRYPGFAAPAPTATRLRLRIQQTGQGAYNGTGTLSITQGSCKIYTNAALAALRADPFDLINPIAINNRELLDGLDLFVLGEATGPITLSLSLSAQLPFVVGPADVQIASAVRLELDAYSFAPKTRKLVERRKIANGKLVPVAGAQAVALRPRVVVKQSNPTGHLGTLFLHVADDAADRVYVRPNDDLADTGTDLLGAVLRDEERQCWLQGRTAGDWFHLGLGLKLPGGELRYGDSVRLKTVDQSRISLGFEWEVPNSVVDRRHAGTPRTEALLPDLVRALDKEDDWEGVPSKAVVFRTDVGTKGMKVVTEVSAGRDPHSYAEFVLGPAYTFAELEEQLGELRRFYRALERHQVLVTHTPEIIHSRNTGEYNVVWLKAGSPLVVAMESDDWKGTAQPSFAVPLWWVPITLAALDKDGETAKEKAEAAAEADARIDDMVLGLIAAIEYYIKIFLGCPKISDGDGPKVRTPLMFRTDFNSMYRLLTVASQRNAFADWVASRAQRDQRLLPKGYKMDDHNSHDQGPLLGEWLDSIIVPLNGKDLLSPPPGMPRYHTQQRIHYSMGVLDADATTSNVIFEYRGGSKQVQYKTFLAMIFEWASEMLFAGASTWTADGDGILTPPGLGTALPPKNAYTAHGNTP